MNTHLREACLQAFQFETVTANDRGEIIARETRTAQQFTEDLGDGIAFDMVSLPGGIFWMGSRRGQGYRTSGLSTA